MGDDVIDTGMSKVFGAVDQVVAELRSQFEANSQRSSDEEWYDHG